MATVGHMVTMVGVLGFYFMLLDSKLEKKLLASLSTLVPRFNKRALYYLGKTINFLIYKKQLGFLPSRSSRSMVVDVLYGKSCN